MLRLKIGHIDSVCAGNVIGGCLLILTCFATLAFSSLMYIGFGKLSNNIDQNMSRVHVDICQA